MIVVMMIMMMMIDDNDDDNDDAWPPPATIFFAYEYFMLRHVEEGEGKRGHTEEKVLLSAKRR